VLCVPEDKPYFLPVMIDTGQLNKITERKSNGGKREVLSVWGWGRKILR
jgi:hypothetical protein